MAVQQQHRRPVSAVAHAKGRLTDVEALEKEALEHNRRVPRLRQRASRSLPSPPLSYPANCFISSDSGWSRSIGAAYRPSAGRPVDQ